jgi:hypothetical protein
MPDDINHINPDKLNNVEQLRKAVVVLLNLVKTLTAQNLAYQKEMPELKDTINLLKVARQQQAKNRTKMSLRKAKKKSGKKKRWKSSLSP